MLKFSQKLGNNNDGIFRLKIDDDGKFDDIINLNVYIFCVYIYDCAYHKSRSAHRKVTFQLYIITQ